MLFTILTSFHTRQQLANATPIAQPCAYDIPLFDAAYYSICHTRTQPTIKNGISHLLAWTRLPAFLAQSCAAWQLMSRSSRRAPLEYSRTQRHPASCGTQPWKHLWKQKGAKHGKRPHAVHESDVPAVQFHSKPYVGIVF